MKKEISAEIGIWPKDRQKLYEIFPIDTPLSMDFMISNVCNFRCNFCIQSASNELFEKSGYRKQFMEWDTFELGVKQVKEFPHKLKSLFLVGQGEPLLHKQLPEMIKLIREMDITEKIVLITNGSVLTRKLSDRLIEAGLQELRISLEGLSTETYQQIAKVKLDWDEFYKNIVYFSRIKRDCKLSAKIADTALNEGDEERFYEMFGDICDAVGIEHIYECFSHLGKNLDVPLSEKNRWGHDLRKIEVCWLPFGKMDLSADGRFTNCCAALFGFEKNIREASMIEVWNGTHMKKMRKDFLYHDTENYEACKRCHVPQGTFHPEDVLDGHEREILERMGY